MPPTREQVLVIYLKNCNCSLRIYDNLHFVDKDGIRCIINKLPIKNYFPVNKLCQLPLVNNIFGLSIHKVCRQPMC